MPTALIHRDWLPPMVVLAVSATMIGFLPE